jgi:nicotinamide mononucleotide transporter
MDWWNWALEPLGSTAISPLEIGAVLTSLACVWLTVRQHLWCWPIGIVSAGLYIIIFRQARLYSDMLLQVFFVLVQFYGWYYWIYGGKRKYEVPITRISRVGTIRWSGGAVAGVLMLGGMMQAYTDADLAYWDATTTVLSIVAQYLMTWKMLECWMIWITVDVLCVGIYYVKGLHLTMGLYAVFLILATIGLLEWRRAWRVQQTSHVAPASPAVEGPMGESPLPVPPPAAISCAEERGQP